MDKKDMFIREKLQQDKVISDKANKIFDNIKEEFKVENNEKKVIKISLGTFIAIAASLVIVGFVGINIYAKSLGKPNIISGVQALLKDEPEEENIILDKVLEMDSIKLKYPSDWEVEKNRIYAEPTILKAPGDNDDESAKLYITVVENTGNRMAKEILDDTTNPDYAVPTNTVVEGVKNIDGTDGYYKTQSMSYDNGNKWQSTTIICVKDGYLYEIMFSAKYDEYEKYYLTFEKMLETIKFIEINDNASDNIPDNTQNSYLDDETAKAVIQSYLNIIGSGSATAILTIQEIGLIDKNSEIPGGDYVDDEGYRSSNIKYEEFKSKMLQYMTEECFDKIINEKPVLYKNNDGKLYIFQSGWTGTEYVIQDIELISLNKNNYIYKINGLKGVDAVENGNDFTATVELQKNKNGEYVVCALEWEENDNSNNSEVLGSISGADAMPDMLKYRSEEYIAKYYYKLAALRDNNDGTYTATVDFHSPIFISEEKYKNIVDSGWGEVEGVSYTFSSKNNEFNDGYGYIYKDNLIYTIEKQERGYAFYSEIGGVIKMIEIVSGSFEMTLDSEFVVANVLHGERMSLKECASILNECLSRNGKITFEYSEDDNIYMLIDWR